MIQTQGAADAELSYDERMERVRQAVRNEPDRMTLQIARQYGVPEREVIRCLPSERVKELPAADWQQILRSLEGIGPVRVLVSNAATTMETVGEFGGFSEFAGFFNVQTPTLDLHIRADSIDAVFAVEKPSHMDGQMTQSIQFFGKDGAAALKVFLTFGTPLSPAAKKLWESLR